MGISMSAREKIIDGTVAMVGMAGMLIQAIQPYLSFILVILSITYYWKKLKQHKENGLDR